MGAAQSQSAIDLLLNGGPIAIVLVLLLTRRLVTRDELDRAVSDRDKQIERLIVERDHEHSESVTLRTAMDDKMVPALYRTAAALEAYEQQHRTGGP